MVTWTTYGSWLQGDKRGYVKNGKIMPGDDKIFQSSRELQKWPTVKLDSEARDIVRGAILNEADRIGQTIEALAVCTNHVHLVARPCNETIGGIVSRYKNIAMFALGERDQVKRLWTRGFDKRFCFSNEDLQCRISYVKKHNNC